MIWGSGSTSTTVPVVELASRGPAALEDDSSFVLREDVDDAGLNEGDAAMGLAESDRSVSVSDTLLLVLAVAASPEPVTMPVLGDPDGCRGRMWSVACMEASAGWMEGSAGDE